MARRIRNTATLTNQQRNAGWTIDSYGQRVSPTGEVLSASVNIITDARTGQTRVARSADYPTNQIPESRASLVQKQAVQNYIQGTGGMLPQQQEQQASPTTQPTTQPTKTKAPQAVPTLAGISAGENPFFQETQIQEAFLEASDVEGSVIDPVAQTKRQLIVLPQVTQVVLGIVDQIRALSTLGGRDTIKIQEARNIYNNLKTGLKLQIDNVAMGGDETDALNNLRDAVNANNLIERTAHRKGVDNLLYWFRGGQELEIEAEVNIQELEDLRDQLIVAIRTKQMRQAGLL